MKSVDVILTRLVELIQQDRFVELETDGVEIKPVPADGGDWSERCKTVNAFLNTRGGILILGVKEEGRGSDRRYAFTGWASHAEPKVKEFSRLFQDRKGAPLDLNDCFPPPEIRDFLGGRIAVIYVDELASDRKFVFYKGTAFRRILTGDHRISETDIDSQEEFKNEAVHARELQPVPGMTQADFDLDKLNQFIFHLNQPAPIETMKPDIGSALPFLMRRGFLKDGVVTILGALVCGKHPGDHLGFRSHVHGYVDVPHEVAQDKQDFVDNVLPLMEFSLGYILRNIQVGVSVERGGISRPQYPEALLRETVNNALAHRDYSINKQVIITIKPGIQLSIRNPGVFRRHLLIEAAHDAISVRRILPEAKPRNPKLADVLRVYRKWEGRAIGMATLVNLCLQNQTDLPYYRLFSEEVCLYLNAGSLLDEKMERLFQSFDGYIATRLDCCELTEEQKLVLSYLIKSEWANERLGYTVLLTPDNNHFDALLGLERANLIQKHAASTPNYPIYIADRTLMKRGYASELRVVFGDAFDGLNQLHKDVLSVVFRFNRFSKTRVVSAKQASFSLWYDSSHDDAEIKEFDRLYRRVRNAFNRLEKDGFVVKDGKGYAIRNDFLTTRLL